MPNKVMSNYTIVREIFKYCVRRKGEEINGGCSDCHSTQSMVELGRFVEKGSEFADNLGLNPCSATSWTSYVISPSLSFHICEMGWQGCFAEVTEIMCMYRS